MATLKVIIAGKEFPLTVDDSKHEEVLKAADTINQKIQKHQEQFKVDVKDALAMCALEYATQNTQLQQDFVQIAPQEITLKKVKTTTTN